MVLGGEHEQGVVCACEDATGKPAAGFVHEVNARGGDA